MKKKKSWERDKPERCWRDWKRVWEISQIRAFTSTFVHNYHHHHWAQPLSTTNAKIHSIRSVTNEWFNGHRNIVFQLRIGDQGLNREASEREIGVHDMKRNASEREIRNIIFFFFGNYFCLVSEKIWGKVFRRVRVRGLSVLA